MNHTHQKRHAIVLGLGASGLSAIKFLASQGLTVWATDDSPEKISQSSEATPNEFFVPIDEAAALLDRYTQNIAYLVISPGVSQNHTLIQRARDYNIEVIGDVELACRALLPYSPTMVAITGTNGKTTVTRLIAHILNYAAISCKAVGNIGAPLLDTVELFEKNQRPVLVVELSSFQLETMSTPIFKTGVILNITPDHLDRHGTIDSYVQAKLRLHSCLTNEGSLFVHESINLRFGSQIPAAARLYGYNQPAAFAHSDLEHLFFNTLQETVLPQELMHKRSHNLENFLAAYAITRTLGIPAYICHDAYPSFTKAPHTLQYIRSINGIHCIDDSKGPNIDAVMRAVESVEGPIILLAGGVHKGESYTAWQKLADKVRHIFAIGQAASLIQQDVGSIIPVHVTPTLQEAVVLALDTAKVGYTILLSPGCSSFDMFHDYKDRGKQFQQIVNEIAAATSPSHVLQ